MATVVISVVAVGVMIWIISIWDTTDGLRDIERLWRGTGSSSSQGFQPLSQNVEDWSVPDASFTGYFDAIRANPDSLDPYCDLALAYYVYGYSEAALLPLEKALAMDPDYSLLHIRRAEALMSLGRTEDALMEYLVCSDLEAGRANIQYDIAMSLSSFQRFDAALRYILEAVRLAPQDATYHLTLGECYLATGQYELAGAVLMETLELSNPGDYEYETALSYLTPQ